MNEMLDFNDAADLIHDDPADTRDAVKAALLERLENVLLSLFPAGKRHGTVYAIGDTLGSPGRSLEIALDGDKAGLWTDRADGVGGDIFDLIAAHLRIDVRHDFARVLEEAQRLLGEAVRRPAPKPRRKQTAVDELGPATAKWEYRDAQGGLIAVVYRYDPPGGKEFRPWDVQRRKAAPPTPRPLYNQPGMTRSTEVILVEGEKCAQALIQAGYCATTAMHGANAPVDKTDWSPLKGKHVVIWPDKDSPGYDYALNAGDATLAAGALSCAMLSPPMDKPEGWDAADALENHFDVAGFLQAGERTPLALAKPTTPATGQQPVDATTDDGLALAFTRQFGEDWRYCAPWGQWLAWSGARWNTDRSLTLQHLIRGVCRAASAFAIKDGVRSRLASAMTVLAVERMARTDRTHAALPEDWDRNPWMFNCPEGVLDLRTGNLRAHSRAEGMTRMATASPRGACPIWHHFLADITGNDPELQAYLQRMAGYCLTGVTAEHALFFLYGTGGNGKSVFVSTLTALYGDYAAIAPMETFMETRGERHPTELAGLRGARFVAAQETEEGRRWNESKIKAITGGDKITARFMRQDFFEYIPQFKLLIAGNHKPSIRNVDKAMKRRLHLVPFTVTIPDERKDIKLTEKLLAERDGILAWAMQGCLEWQRMGLAPPASVRAATEEYFEAEDAHGRWQDEHGELSNNASTPVRALYDSWKRWAEACGEFPGSIKRFSAELQARGFKAVRVTGGTRHIVGLKLQIKPFEPSDLDGRYDWN